MITWPCWVRSSVRQERLPEQAPFLHAQETEGEESLAGELNSNLWSSTKPHFLKVYPTVRTATPGMRPLQSDEHVVDIQHQDHSGRPVL